MAKSQAKLIDGGGVKFKFWRLHGKVTHSRLWLKWSKLKLKKNGKVMGSRLRSNRRPNLKSSFEETLMESCGQNSIWAKYGKVNYSRLWLKPLANTQTWIIEVIRTEGQTSSFEDLMAKSTAPLKSNLRPNFKFRLLHGKVTHSRLWLKLWMAQSSNWTKNLMARSWAPGFVRT